MPIDVQVTAEGARAVVGSVTFEATGRYGAVHALARKLVAAGISDGPLHLRRDGIAGFAPVQSLHALAKAEGL